MIRRFLLLAALALLAAGSAQASENNDQPERLVVNPFTLPRNRIVPGTDFLIEIVQDGAVPAGDPAKTLFDPDQEKVLLTLQYAVKGPGGQKGETKTIRVRTLSLKVVEGRRFIEAHLPDMGSMPGQMQGIETQSRWDGVLFPYRATLVATVSNGSNEKSTFEYPVQIPSVGWAYAWGIFVVSVIIFILAFARKSNGWGRWDPLGPTTTPVGGYSVSLAQILIWSYVTVFGLVYVYWLTANFLDISAQMLMLLGIGGATAIAKKIAGGSSVPAKYLALLPTRTPKLRDLIWRGGERGSPDLFKIQMLIFTLLTAYIVLVEIARKYAFPSIPDNLVALMGVSSAVYVGNSATLKSEREKGWAEIEPQVREKAAQIEKAPGSQRQALQEELQEMLEGLY